MKKIISVFLCILMMISLFSFTGYAVQSESGENQALGVKAKSAVLMDAKTGKVLWAYNEHESLFPASVTKIMPLLLFMEAID